MPRNWQGRFLFAQFSHLPQQSVSWLLNMSTLTSSESRSYRSCRWRAHCMTTRAPCNQKCLADPGIAEVSTRDATFAALLAFTHASWWVSVWMIAPYLSFTPWTGFFGEFDSAAAYQPMLCTIDAGQYSAGAYTRDATFAALLTFALTL